MTTLITPEVETIHAEETPVVETIEAVPTEATPAVEDGRAHV